MPGHEIIVIGASAGGVETLINLVRDIPKDIPASLFVVLHFPAHATSVLPDILTRKGILPASHPRDREPIVHGHIYIAPPDCHMLVRHGQVRVVAGPRENGHRPAIDPLFRSAARTYGASVVGVVLSGALDDGTAGLVAIKAHGGKVVVQDPADALYSSMPQSALRHVSADYVLPLSEIGNILTQLACEEVPQGETSVPRELDVETEMTEFTLGTLHASLRPGKPAGFVCPECGGVLWEIMDQGMLRFRCRVGHVWSADSLLAEQNDSMEEALWTALRALEESAALSERLADNAERGHRAVAAERFRDKLDESRNAAALIREVLLSSGGRALRHHDTGLNTAESRAQEIE